jgi:Fe-S cluster assembly iron-binding protein IscA
MITITPEASRRLLEYLESRNVPATVRICASRSACGPSGGLSLTVEGPGPGDWSGEEGGITFLMERGLLDVTGRVAIGYVSSGEREGFTVTAEKELPLPVACAACDGCR